MAADGYQSLTEKEKQTLRLMLRGHDAKSLARHLDLSVHTVNERLRDARRKLAVTSSREAARLLLEREGGAPELLGDEHLRDAATPIAPPGEVLPAARARGRMTRPRGVAGAIVMSLVLGLAVFAALSADIHPVAQGSSSPSAGAPAAAQSSEAADAARAWLELGDRARWEDGWRATSSDFRRLNTAAAWAEASTKVRAPLGAVRTRTLLSQDAVPAPPAGVVVIKFRTDFANRAGAIETVSLAREDGAWKVAGVYLD